MQDEPMQQWEAQSPTKEPAVDYLKFSNTSRPKRNWLRTFCVGMLTLCHVMFFLPLRALAPLPPDADPWWGMGLVLVDIAVAWGLIRRGLRKITGKKPRKWSE